MRLLADLGSNSEPFSGAWWNYFVLWWSVAVSAVALVVLGLRHPETNRKTFEFTLTAGVSRAGART